MMPFYRHMDSYPNQRNQMPFPQYYYPSNDGIPPHMMMDQAKSPMINESWPHGSNHAYPMPFHPCGNHGNFPGYYNFQPPLPHFSPSPPHHCCGHNPSFSEQYPVHYPFPPHHWRYEYDKDMHRDFHCCGCPNHIHNQKDDKGVKIEEQEPDVKKPSDLLVPFQLKNHSYPMLWIPPEYMKKYNEHREPLESKVADQDTVAHSTKSHGNMRSSDWEPGIWNGWFPLDMNNLKSLVQGEDEKRLKNQQYDDKMKQLPFPFFWMPSKNEQEEAEKKGEGKMNGWLPVDASSMKSLMQGDDEKRQNQQNKNQMRQFPYPIIWMSPDNSKPREGEKKDQKEANAAPMSAEEPHCSFKFVPVKPLENDDGMIKSKTNEEISGSQVKSSQKEGTANQKSIPVKQVEVRNEDNSEDCEEKVREITAKKAENMSTDSPSGTGTKRQSSSPPRMSKLPPVCLRLEPLPRKKNGNGSSRSPSPPSPKVRSQEASENTSNPSAPTKVKENSSRGSQAPDVSLKNDEEGEPQRYDKNAIDVVGAKTSEDKNYELNNGSQREISVNLPVNSQEVVSKVFSVVTIGKDTDESKNEEDKGATCEKDVMAESTTQAKIATGSAKTADGSRARIKDLCDEEAATLIQSAYRAYEVRKLEPLKKLKQMAAVSEQLGEVKNCIQALESSDLENNDKERVVIGEMIMSLLLKLDTIQGLHPSLREFRKALAKELVTLQEKLDSLMMKRPKESFENVSTTKPADDPNIVTQNKVGIFENKLEAGHDNDGNMAEQDKGLLLQVESVVSNSQGQKILEPLLTSAAVRGRCENQKELPMTTGENSIDSEMVSDLQVECEASHKELGGTRMSMAETKERDAVHPKLKQSVELPSISEEKTSSEELVNSLLQGSYSDLNRENEDKVVRHGDLIDESKELPAKILDGEHVVSELEKNEVAGEEHMFPSLPLASAEVENMVPEADNDDMGTDSDTETNLLTELPLGVIEDDLTLSASGEHEQIEKVKVEAPSSEEASFDMASNTTLPVEETSLNEIATDATSQMDEASSLNEVMQHSPKVELGDDAKVVTEELLRDAALENKRTEPSISTAREGNSDKILNEERDHSMIDVYATPMLEAAVTSIATPESDEKKGDEQQQEPYGIEEEDLPEKKPQEEEPKCTINDNKMEERELDGNKEKGVLEHKPEYQQPECTNDDNKMDELPHQLEAMEWDVHVATPSSSRSIEEYGIMMERDKKLIEENVKLREMMEKLMEAGKEQLSVISNLTGRVKDLERKLSKKKRLRTSKHKKATLSITKLQNMKERAVDVAM